MGDIIGRKRELILLKEILTSKKAEFLALYGRRRVGKTYMIKNFFDKQSAVFFHVTGIQQGSLAYQLEEFAKQIGQVFYGGAAITPRARWVDAFEDLTKAILQVPKGKKVVLFMDEFPWMATARSGLLNAVDLYWNRYWVNDERLKLIICGSATSWIIEKIINNKGGLHNRVTRTIQLDPFSLCEVETFLQSEGINLNRWQILSLYMAIGGVPLYWSFVRKGHSAHQQIDNLCFEKDGALTKEFERLFASLFDDAEIYVELIRIIAKHRYGIAQTAIFTESEHSMGGRVVHRLRQLEESGFITSFVPYGHKSKGIYYRIDDEYCLFYLEWIEPYLKTMAKKERSQGYWISQSQLPSWKSWSGYAFEAICYKHIAQIRKALNIDPGAHVGTWRYSSQSKSSQTGAQIDLLFDRADGIITICEIKCTEEPFAIDKSYAQTLLNKMDVYRKQTRTKKQLFLAMVVASGLRPTMYSEELVTNEVQLDDLFRK